MKRNIQMIGLDLDGTTLLDHVNITPPVRATIEKAIAKGIVVLPATGRTLGGIAPAMLQIPGVRYAVSANGARIYNLEAQKTLHTDCFSTSSALSVLQFLRQYDVMISLFINGQGYDEGQGDSISQILSPALAKHFKDSRRTVPSLENLIADGPDLVEKFSLLFYTQHERLRALDAAKQRSDVGISWSIPLGLELNTPTANKGAALVALGKLLDIPQQNIMAIGDGHNDIDMLRTVGYGVAMGNAEDPVKAAADAVTLSCEEDGVAAAIESIL